jgi:hypothetical protein
MWRMSTKRWTFQPAGRIGDRLLTAVDTLRDEGIASTDAAALTLIVARGLDVIEAEQAARDSNRPTAEGSKGGARG